MLYHVFVLLMVPLKCDHNRKTPETHSLVPIYTSDKWMERGTINCLDRITIPALRPKPAVKLIASVQGRGHKAQL